MKCIGQAEYAGSIVLTLLPSPRSLHKYFSPQSPAQPVASFCLLDCSFIYSQALGAPCSHTINFSGVSWLKPELGEELLMIGSYSTGPSWGWRRSGDPHSTHPTSSAKSCLAQHFLPSFLVASFQGLLSVPGPYKGPFDEKFEAK